jgi:hypothetical protein
MGPEGDKFPGHYWLLLLRHISTPSPHPRDLYEPTVLFVPSFQLPLEAIVKPSVWSLRSRRENPTVRLVGYRLLYSSTVEVVDHSLFHITVTSQLN